MTPLRVPSDNNDRRVFELRYDPYGFNLSSTYLYFSQRELRLLLKHLEGRNHPLHKKIKDFTLPIDDKERCPTDFSLRVPRTALVRTR